MRRKYQYRLVQRKFIIKFLPKLYIYIYIVRIVEICRIYKIKNSMVFREWIAKIEHKKIYHVACGVQKKKKQTESELFNQIFTVTDT